MPNSCTQTAMETTTNCTLNTMTNTQLPNQSPCGTGTLGPKRNLAPGRACPTPAPGPSARDAPGETCARKMRARPARAGTARARSRVGARARATGPGIERAPASGPGLARARCLAASLHLSMPRASPGAWTNPAPRPAEAGCRRGAAGASSGPSVARPRDGPAPARAWTQPDPLLAGPKTDPAGRNPTDAAPKPSGPRPSRVPFGGGQTRTHSRPHQREGSATPRLYPRRPPPLPPKLRGADTFAFCMHWSERAWGRAPAQRPRRRLWPPKVVGKAFECLSP